MSSPSMSPHLARLPKPLQVRAMRASLDEFVRSAWHVVEPSTPLHWNWHHDTICHRLQAHLLGKDGKQNLYIATPPGAMKSTITSVMTLPWRWTFDPGYRGGYFSGAEKVAERDSIRARDIIRSDWYQDTFKPTWKFAADQDSKFVYRNTVGGLRYAAPSGARVTGLRFTDIFLDDIMDMQYVLSDAYRNSVNREFWPAVANRLSDMRTGKRVGIAQRLHEDDWPGFATNQAPDEWDTLILRSIKEEGDNIPGDPRKVGDLLDPVRFPMNVLNSEKNRLGSLGFASQHQQKPQAAEGNFIKRNWFNFYRRNTQGQFILDNGEVINPQAMTVFLTADIAGSDANGADFTAVGTWGLTDTGKIIWIDLWHDRSQVAETVDRLKNLWRSNSSLSFLGVEKNNLGLHVVQQLKLAGIPVRDLVAVQGKTSRANTAAIDAENGRFFLPETADWTSRALGEICSFPLGTKDDILDCFAWAAICASRMGAYETVASETQPISLSMSSINMSPWKR